MDTAAKVALDRLVAQPIAWGCTGAAWALGRVLRRDHRVDPARVRTIVVAKILGMGSIVQATPFLHALRRGFPQARVVFVTSVANRELVSRLPVIDQAIYLRDGGVATLGVDVLAAVGDLAGRGVDLYFDLEVYSAGASILALASLARNRYGFYRHSARFKRGNYTHLVFFNVRMPVSRLYLQLYHATGGSPALEPPPLGPITVTASDIAKMREKIATMGIGSNERYLVANPNASDLLLERRWPADRFAAAIDALADRGHRVILIGAPNEAAYVRSVHDRLSPRAREMTVNAAGVLSLAEVFALIHEASCVITNDTGPMHLSIAMGRPTVCLFGPGSPDHYGVHSPEVGILYKSVVCSPCIYETDEAPCNGNNVCMQLIEPSEVVDLTLSLLGGEQSVPASEKRHLPLLDGEVRYLDGGGRALGVVARASVAAARR